MSAFGSKADIGRAPRELSLFLPRVLLRENRVPVFLVGRGDRFLAFAPAIVGRDGGRRPRPWIRLHLEYSCSLQRPRFLERGQLWFFGCRWPTSFLTLSGLIPSRNTTTR